MKSSLHGVVCYWEFIPSKTESRRDCEWKLHESFGIDEDGHCLFAPSTGGGSRYEWHKWLNEVIKKDEEEDLGDVIDGRAVTIWTMQDGVRLLGFNPPEPNRWLSINFPEKICKMSDWSLMLERGYMLYFGTTEEAMKYVTLKDKK